MNVASATLRGLIMDLMAGGVPEATAAKEVKVWMEEHGDEFTSQIEGEIKKAYRNATAPSSMGYIETKDTQFGVSKMYIGTYDQETGKYVNVSGYAQPNNLVLLRGQPSDQTDVVFDTKPPSITMTFHTGPADFWRLLKVFGLGWMRQYERRKKRKAWLWRKRR